MYDLFHSIVSMPTPFNMIVLVVLIGAVASIIKGIAKYMRQYACHRNDLEFKRDLLDRGMSAGEIEQVIRARSPSSKSDD
jgi:hypothetical protein